MNNYELVTILDPEISNDDLPERVGRITTFIEARGGEVENVDQWGRRRLAYPIERRVEGNYVVTTFRLEPRSVEELEATLRLSEDVLRHLVIRHTQAELAAIAAANQRRRQRMHSEEHPEEAAAAATADGAQGEGVATETPQESAPNSAPPEASVESGADNNESVTVADTTATADTAASEA